jgi:hypothetical protein
MSAPAIPDHKVNHQERDEAEERNRNRSDIDEDMFHDPSGFTRDPRNHIRPVLSKGNIRKNNYDEEDKK